MTKPTYIVLVADQHIMDERGESVPPLPEIGQEVALRIRERHARAIFAGVMNGDFTTSEYAARLRKMQSNRRLCPSGLMHAPIETDGDDLVCYGTDGCPMDQCRFRGAARESVQLALGLSA